MHLMHFIFIQQQLKKKHWNKLILDYHVESKDEILMDIALGKKVNVMVAHQLTNLMDGVASNKKANKDARCNYN